jgi:hypothetical protein
VRAPGSNVTVLPAGTRRIPGLEERIDPYDAGNQSAGPLLDG